MFHGEKVVRFFSHAGEASVMQTVQDAVGRLGETAVDRTGGIHVRPDRGFGSALTDTSINGRLRRRHTEFEVRIAYRCRPTAAAWVVAALGTLPLLAGWPAVLASWSMRRRVEREVCRVLREFASRPEELPEEDACLARGPRRRAFADYATMSAVAKVG
jgi:hypothetical protein